MRRKKNENNEENEKMEKYGGITRRMRSKKKK
jgi:hypothetical protein